MSGTMAQIAINIYGESLPMLRRLAKDVELALKALPSTRDVNANREVLVETLAVNFRRADLTRFGLSSEDAGAQLKRALYGDVVSVIHQGVQSFDLVIRLEEDQRDSVEDVENVVLVGMGGALVKLHEVADIGPEQSSNLISRQNGQRKTVVSTNVAKGYNLGDTVAEIQNIVNPIVLGAGYGVEYAGQFEAQQSASRTILWVGTAVVLLMLLLLSVALEGVRPALLVLLNLPLAMIGGIVAMFWAESQVPMENIMALFGLGGRYVPPVISIASLVGLITLFGIAVRNGILLVNHFRWLMENEDLPLEDAVKKGCQ
jgi:HME family heavy-metal exporter